MKAIQVTCPNCGARLRVGETSTVVRCEYCGTDSTVQRRTGILERVTAPPPQAGRVAVQRHSRVWIVSLLFGLVLPVGLGGYIAWSVMSQTRAARERVQQAFAPRTKPATPVPTAPVRSSLSWQGTESVLIADINGDGKPELIGRGREVQNGDIVRLIALDLATGAVKWQSEPLGTYTETYRGLLGIDRDALIYTTEQGAVRTFSAADGKPRWRVQLDERIKELCVGTEGEIAVATADEQVRLLSRADGKQVKATKGTKRRTYRGLVCPQSLPIDGETELERLKASTSVPSTLERKLDLDVDVVVDGPGGRVAGGQRTKGTRVTTLVGLDAANTERWRTTASDNPLGSEGAPRYLTVGRDAACIVYYGTEYRLACFALADGKHLWDEPAPSFFEGLYALDDALVMTTHRQLEVRDLHTGKVRWMLE